MKINFVSRFGVVLCGVLVVGAAFAQKPPAGGPPGGPPGGMRRQGGGGQRYMDQLVKDLALTPAQKTKVEALMKARRAKMDAARKANAGKPMDMKTAMATFQKMQADMDKDMKKILTAPQWKKYQVIQAKRRADMEKRMKAGGGPGMRGPGGPGMPPGKGGRGGGH